MLQVLIILVGICMAFHFLALLNNRKKDTNNWCLGILFGGYMISNFYFTLFSRDPMPETLFEWRPFASYIRMLQDANEMVENQLNGWPAEFFLNTTHPIQGIILNVLLYVPLGYLLLELFRKLSNKQVLLIAFITTFCTELTQLIFKLGWCETDDLIHNMLGAVIGLAIHRWQEKKGILKTQNQE